MSKEKKAFKDTLFGKIVGKAGSIIPDVLGVGMKVMKGDIGGAFDDVIGHLKNDKDPKNKALVNELTTELTNRRDEIFNELKRIELEETQAYLGDVQNARGREIEYVKMGKVDWMQRIVGILGLTMLGFNLYAVVFLVIPEQNEMLFTHFMGIIEGVALSIFSYYFGSSKGSSDKTNLLGNK